MLRRSHQGASAAECSLGIGRHAGAATPERRPRPRGEPLPEAENQVFIGGFAQPGCSVAAAWDDVAVQLTRIAWLVTVGICLVGALMLFLAGYQGYGVLAISVGIAAGINLT